MTAARAGFVYITKWKLYLLVMSLIFTGPCAVGGVVAMIGYIHHRSKMDEMDAEIMKNHESIRRMAED